MSINWPRVVVAGFLASFWILFAVAVPSISFDNTDRIVFTLFFCFSFLILALAFGEKRK